MITAIPQKSQIEQYHTIYSKLQTFVDSIDSRLINKIQSIQHNFADQYKLAVTIMNQELQQIRSRLDAAALKQKANQKMRVLEQERDCFREMSKDLDIKLKEEIKNNKDLREEVRIYKDELDNYKKICFKLEMQMSKSRRQMNEIYRSQSVNKQKKQKPSVDLEPIKQDNKSLRKAKQTIFNSTSKMKRSFSSTLYRTEKIKIDPKNQIQSTFQFQEILSNCIKTIKKEIFYRTGSSLSSNYGFFMQDDSVIPFDKLTLTDKKQLIKLFMEDPKVLDKFYSFVFSKNNSNEQKSMRPFDNQFNQTNLLLIKRKFQDRLASTKLASVKNF